MDRKRLQIQRTIQKILWKKGIHSNTTENETKSAFAERNIRSLKNLIYRFLEEKWSWSYITEIPQFVNINNSRVNRFAKLAPNKVFKKLEPYLNSLSLDNNKYKRRFKAGDFVRIAKPNEMFRKGYTKIYTNEVFTITKKLQSARPLTTLWMQTTKKSWEKCTSLKLLK